MGHLYNGQDRVTQCYLPKFCDGRVEKMIEIFTEFSPLSLSYLIFFNTVCAGQIFLFTVNNCVVKCIMIFSPCLSIPLHHLMIVIQNVVRIFPDVFSFYRVVCHIEGCKRLLFEFSTIFLFSVLKSLIFINFFIRRYF